MKRGNARRLVVAGLAAALLGGCATSLEPWERGDLAATPMTVGDAESQRPERSIEVYREGAVGANGGKSGGGCGCT